MFENDEDVMLTSNFGLLKVRVRERERERERERIFYLQIFFF